MGNRREIIAAVLAHSNMGNPHEPAIEVAQELLKSGKCTGLQDAVCTISGAQIESEEHERAFYDEAEMWLRTIARKQDQQLLYTWPWLKPLIEREPNVS